MTLDDVLRRLENHIHAKGGAASWAREMDISASYISDVLNRRREPGPRILKAMGLESVTIYQEKN